MGSEEETHKYVLDHVRAKYAYTYLSSDLTAATDYVSLEAIQIVLDEIRNRYDLTDLQKRYIDKCLSSDLEYEIDGKTYHVKQRRGSLMGLPHTWSVLNLLHLFAVEYAAKKATSAYGYWSRKVAVCGDDLLAPFESENHVAWYRYAIESLGFKLNETKTFRSVTHGVFCE